jgi:hypothetical protein
MSTTVWRTAFGVLRKVIQFLHTHDASLHTPYGLLKHLNAAE